MKMPISLFNKTDRLKSDNNSIKNDINFTNSIFLYFVLAFVVAFSYFFFMPVASLPERQSAVSLVIYLAFFAVGLFCIYEYYRDEFNLKHLLVVIIICGIIMRIGYMGYTLFNQRAHDIGAAGNAGHYDYFFSFYKDFSLPENNYNQQYHPPLMAFLSSLVARIVEFFRQSKTPDLIIDSAKIVSCFASCGILIVCYKITNILNFSIIAKIAAISVIAFHPTFYILSASINNDVLMIFFFMSAVLYTIKWYYKPNFKNISLLALLIGLAMMTKISGAVIALFTAPIFLIVLIKTIRMLFYDKNKQKLAIDDTNCQISSNYTAGIVKIKSLCFQFATFLLISVPLGLWYPIRNMIKFGQPLNYVVRLSDSNSLFCGDHSIVERFLSFPISQLFDPQFCLPREDYNLWVYTVKCSAFGEFSFNDDKGIMTAVLVISTLLVILLSLISLIYVLFRCKTMNKFIKYGLTAVFLTQIISFVYFNFQYPFGCTMDTRYIVPAIACGALIIGAALGEIIKKDKIIYKILASLGFSIIIIFSISSIIFYS